jgi:hypothetical protein
MGGARRGFSQGRRKGRPEFSHLPVILPSAQADKASLENDETGDDGRAENAFSQAERAEINGIKRLGQNGSKFQAGGVAKGRCKKGKARDNNKTISSIP